MPSITGNTPITFTAAQLLGNDVDPDGAEINLVISGVSAATNGAIVNNGNGTFTFTPNTGYRRHRLVPIHDHRRAGPRQRLDRASSRFTVTDPVWYVDASYTGVNGASDGSYLKPFTTLANLSTGGSADALDNADDTIFVYNTGAYTTGIVLETGQKLFGDGHAFSVNGLTIGANASNATIGHAGVGVTLATNNTIMGVTLNGTANGAVGIEDGGAERRHAHDRRDQHHRPRQGGRHRPGRNAQRRPRPVELGQLDQRGRPPPGRHRHLRRRHRHHPDLDRHRRS